MREYFKLEVLDGGMGTILQSRGLLPGETPEDWCIDHPEIISEIQRGYIAAGSDIIYASTFGANVLKYQGLKLPTILLPTYTSLMYILLC